MDKTFFELCTGTSYTNSYKDSDAVIVHYSSPLLVDPLTSDADQNIQWTDKETRFAKHYQKAKYVKFYQELSSGEFETIYIKAESILSLAKKINELKETITEEFVDYD